MRLLGALFVTILILGGLKLFFNLREHHRPAPAAWTAPAPLQDDYTLEIVLTFDAAADAFALDPQSAAALVVERAGETLYVHKQPIAAGSVLNVPLPRRLTAAENELFLRATAAADAPAIPHAMRVRLVNEFGTVLADKTLWSEPGSPVEGLVRVNIEQPARVMEGPS